MLRSVNESQFNAEVAALARPLVVQFGASWCGPCKQMTPEIESAAKTLDGSVDFVKVDIDQCRALAQRWGIRSVPTLLLLVRGAVDGQVIEAKRMLGASKAGVIASWAQG